MSLSIEGASKTIKGQDVLSDVTFSVVPGEVVGVVGENGIGKTTLLRLIAGMTHPDGCKRIAPSQNGKQIAYLPQNPRSILFLWYRAWKNISHYSNGDGKKKTNAIQHLKEVGFSESDSRKFPNELSGGFRQRLAWACVLERNPDFLLLDEPFSAQDSRWIKFFVEKIRDLKTENRSVVLVAHMPRLLVAASDRLVFLRRTEKGATIGEEMKITVEESERRRLHGEEMSRLSVLVNNLVVSGERG